MVVLVGEGPSDAYPHPASMTAAATATISLLIALLSTFGTVEIITRDGAGDRSGPSQLSVSLLAVLVDCLVTDDRAASTQPITGQPPGAPLARCPPARTCTTRPPGCAQPRSPQPDTNQPARSSLAPRTSCFLPLQGPDPGGQRHIRLVRLVGDPQAQQQALADRDGHLHRGELHVIAREPLQHAHGSPSSGLTSSQLAVRSTATLQSTYPVPFWLVRFPRFFTPISSPGFGVRRFSPFSRAACSSHRDRSPPSRFARIRTHTLPRYSAWPCSRRT